KNTIADGVVEKVAGIAARQVPGVHDLGNGAARAVGAIRNVIGQQDRGQGISVEVGETQVVGMEVTEVNVTITDVNLPSDKSSDDDAAEKRVQ
ncbi:Asp23/Gls24 family envelope stress response protein, partial [Clavibacter sp.]